MSQAPSQGPYFKSPLESSIRMGPPVRATVGFKPAARIGTRTSPPLESILAVHTCLAVSASKVTSTWGGGHRYIPQPELNHTTARPHLFDGARHIFSMYLEMAVEEDKMMTEAWKADADAILIFVSISPVLFFN